MVMKYKACCDILVALGLIVSLIVLIMCTCMIAKIRNKNEEYTIEYIVKVSIGLGTGCLFFGLSVIYFYMQYQDFHRKQRDDWDSSKYKPVVILGGSDCAICLKEKDSRSEPVVTLFCNHEFHKKCARGWILFSEKERCCLCRSSISSFTTCELTDAMKQEKSFIQSNTSVSKTVSDQLYAEKV
ncbi:uncharacterized protein LOC143063965 isoform X2 [Mytilus galloprovincialis]|uniref:uncharacterized protein LOC143063965 isoform X2 n=1 Tax=Mytilus galloprovincialis TaxID=29158 RepID=UPI003F7C0CBC